MTSRQTMLTGLFAKSVKADPKSGYSEWFSRALSFAHLESWARTTIVTMMETIATKIASIPMRRILRFLRSNSLLRALGMVDDSRLIYAKLILSLLPAVKHPHIDSVPYCLICHPFRGHWSPHSIAISKRMEATLCINCVTASSLWKLINDDTRFVKEECWCQHFIHFMLSFLY